MSDKPNKFRSVLLEMRNGHKRWGILLMLFLATVIMFIDRQSLSVLAPAIIADLHINSEQYSHVVMAFMVATAVAQLPLGPLLDKIGVRLGLGISFVVWTIASGLHALTTGAPSLMIYRAALGAAEASDVPASSKAVAEWFPPKERGFAMGFFSGGAAMGALIAPPILALLATIFGWRVAFIVIPVLSAFWAIAWFRIYRSPKTHPSLCEEERALIARGAASEDVTRHKSSLIVLLASRNFWGIAIARMVYAPISAFGYYWLPLFLSQRYHLSLIEIGAVAWIPYLAQDIGSMLGGALSGAIIKDGRSPARARLIIIGIGAFLTLGLLPTAWVLSPWAAVALISLTTLALGSFSANIFALAADQFDSGDVATVVGWSQATLFLGGTTFTYFLGKVAGGAYLPTFASAAGLALFGFVVLMVLNWGNPPARVRSDKPALSS